MLQRPLTDRYPPVWTVPKSTFVRFLFRRQNVETGSKLEDEGGPLGIIEKLQGFGTAAVDACSNRSGDLRQFRTPSTPRYWPSVPVPSRYQAQGPPSPAAALRFRPMVHIGAYGWRDRHLGGQGASTVAKVSGLSEPVRPGAYGSAMKGFCQNVAAFGSQRRNPGRPVSGRFHGGAVCASPSG